MLFHKDEKGVDTQNHLRLYSIPLFLYDTDNPSGKERIGMFSSVAVRIKDRYFFFTAGHCVDDYLNDGKPYNLYALVSNNNSQASTTAGLMKCIPARENKIVEQERGMDIGYFEIPPVTVTAIQTQNKLFLPEHRLEVMKSSDYRRGLRPVMLYGYPEERLLSSGKVRTVNAISLMYKDAEAKQFTVSEYPVAPADGVNVIDFAVTEEANQFTGNSEEEATSHVITINSLTGASGCGWWYLPKEEDKWDPSQLRLIATHFGRLKPKNFPRTVHRAVMIGHHLKLIAQDYPDLKEHIESTWSILS